MKKNIILGIVLLVVAITLIIIKNKGSYMEGRVVDITYYENKVNKSNILMIVNDEPFVIHFDDIDIKDIKLNDILKVKTNGVVMESFPAQTNALSFKIINNNSIKIKGEYDPSDIDSIKTIVFKSFYYEEESNYKSRFKTKIINNKKAFNEFITSKNIIIPKDINVNNIFNNYTAVISYTNMSSSGYIDFSGLYKEDNKMYIYIKINSNENTTTDIITRGVISFINNEYSNNEFETLSKYIYE